jgi:hypothetical protein
MELLGRNKPKRRTTDHGLTTWSAADKAILQKTIDPLHNAFRKQPVGFLHSETTTLLCTPREEVYDRLTTFLSTCCMVSGLVLSAVAGIALNPLKADDFADDKKTVVEAFNVVAALTVATQLCVVLYSTFTLYILISSAHNPAAVYRALMHMQRWIGFLEFATFVPAIGTFALVAIAAHLHCGRVASGIVLAVCCALVVGFQAAFCAMCNSAFPYNAWAWATVASAAYPWLSSRVEKDARTHGELLLAQAKDGVLSGLDENHDGVIDTKEAEEESASEAELSPWVKGAIGPLQSTDLRLLVEQLLGAGLTRARLFEAARHPGGFQALCIMLESAAISLRPGDRLALASAAMEGGRQSQAAATSK